MKSILVVVSHLPYFKTNAGDWRAYWLCKTLAKKYRIFLLPLSYYWEHDILEKEIRKTGVKIVYPRNSNSSYFKKFIKQNKINTVIFRSHNILSSFRSHLPLFRHIIIDTHDVQYVKESRRTKLLFGKRAAAREELINKNAEISMLDTADTLIAISEKDKRTLTKELPAKRIIVIPTPVLSQNREIAFRNYSKRKDIVFLGHFCRDGANEDSIKYFLSDIFPLIQKRIPGVKFCALGFGSERLKSTNSGFMAAGYSDNIYKDLGKYRVFVCPMRYGAGVKKKILDAMASKTPVVTTSIGAEGIDARREKDILITDKASDFANKVYRLYCNEELWTKISSRGYCTVMRLYSENAVKRAMKNLYSLIGK